MRTVRRQLAACLLFAAGGIIDAYSYCGCDGVLANVQTVNLLLAGMSFAQADWQNVLRYSVPIVAYCLGVAAFLFCQRRCQESKWQFRGIPVFVFKELLVLAPMFFSPAPASFSLSAACGFGIEEYDCVKKVNANIDTWHSASNLIVLLAFIFGIIAGMALFGWLGSFTLLVPGFLLLGAAIAQQNI